MVWGGCEKCGKCGGLCLCLVPLNSSPDARGIHEADHTLGRRIPRQVGEFLIQFKSKQVVPRMRPIPILTTSVSPPLGPIDRLDDLQSSSAPAKTWRRNYQPSPSQPRACRPRSSASCQTVPCRRPGRSWAAMAAVRRLALRDSRGCARGRLSRPVSRSRGPFRRELRARHLYELTATARDLGRGF